MKYTHEGRSYKIEQGLQLPTAPLSVEAVARWPESAWNELGTSTAVGSDQPWAPPPITETEPSPPKSPWESGAYSADTEPGPCQQGHDPQQLVTGCDHRDAIRSFRVAITEQLGCGVVIDIPQEKKAKQESPVEPVVSVVSCQPHDWTCGKCGWNCTEKDTSRRWVKPRPCYVCNTLMTTWRTSDSVLPIFKPTGSIP